MGKPVIQSYSLGGVDSRSNPLLMPTDRALRCLNWVPTESGYLRLRHGYTKPTQDAASGAAVHSIVHYKMLSGSRYLLIGSGSAIKRFDLGAGTLTTPTVKGAGLTGTGRWSWALANNAIHGVNGTDTKWYDGTALRDSGIAPISATDAAKVTVVEGVREATKVERDAVVLTPGAGGSFAATTLAGRLVYVAYARAGLYEIGPATLYAGAGRVTLPASGKISLSGLPNLSTVNADWIKLLAITEDGANVAHFCTNTSTAITIAGKGTAPHEGEMRIDSVAHGLSIGDIVEIAGNVNDLVNGIWAVSDIVGADTFYIANDPPVLLGATGGTVKRIISVANATTTATILAGTVGSYVVNADRGIPPTAVANENGVDPGYQFYFSWYNRIGGGHVSNRVAIPGRFAPTTRCNARILCNFSSSDTELDVLIGRTGDGGQVPYVCADADGNWIHIPGSAMYGTISAPTIDVSAEMPTRNAVPPKFDKMIRVDDRFYGNCAGSPTIYISQSVTDATAGTYVGRPEQSFPADNIMTFPTAESVTCLAESEMEAFIFTLSDAAILSSLTGTMAWRGPWNVGCAGQRAFAKSPYGPVWVTGDKQLASVSNGAPVPISSEYELALLSQIGDAYLSQTEVEYLRDTDRNVDCAFIKSRKADGTPLVVVHDFKLKDGRSPLGQGYEYGYGGVLAGNFTFAQIRDANDKMRLWAGASDGYLYQLVSGSDDNGTQYAADYIMLLNPGEGREAINPWTWQGDKNLKISIGKTLKTSLLPSSPNAFSSLTPGKPAFADGQEQFTYESEMQSPEMQSFYLRLQLTSHSADGNLNYSAVPHIPVEDYGRVYCLKPSIGDARA